ncbi:MAG: signal peptidase II [Anaerolineales bacterium]|nr:signal peptidase II [Anaerolineales bacterium]
MAEREIVTWRHWLLLFGVAALTLVSDQLSKWLVVRSLDLGETWVPIPLLEGIFDLTYTQNTGAAFGLGQNFSYGFLLIALVVSAFIIYYYRQLPPRSWMVRILMGLMMGGALGNAVDRVTRGYVVDFFYLHGWPIFNIADSIIVVSVGIWVVLIWWEEHQQKAPAEEAPPHSSEHHAEG